jgi:hypothetical protein
LPPSGTLPPSASPPAVCSPLPEHADSMHVSSDTISSLDGRLCVPPLSHSTRVSPTMNARR